MQRALEANTEMTEANALRQQSTANGAQQQPAGAVAAFSSSVATTVPVTETIRIKLSGGGTKLKGEVEYLMPDGSWLDRQGAATVISQYIWGAVCTTGNQVQDRYACQDPKYVRAIMHQALRNVELAVQEAKAAFR
jgi:beta-lactam-binding protein with PASTA domain